MTAPAGNVLLFDSDCGFCTTYSRWVEGRANGRLRAVPWQSVDLDELGLTIDQVTTAAYWLEDGSVSAGASDAIGRSLVTAGGVLSLAGRAIASRPVRPLAAAVYRRVAANRHRIPIGDGVCAMPPTRDGGAK